MKVEKLIGDGLKLKDVRIIRAKRRQYKNSKPGVVFITVKNIE